MTEQVPPTSFQEPETDASEGGDATSEADLGGPTTTGVPAVDQVLTEADRLDDLPLEEHLATFERAHESLRDALDAAPPSEVDSEPTGEPTGEHSHRPDDPA